MPDQDHPTVNAWLAGAHKVVALGGSFRITCVVRTKAGKSYGMPMPPTYVAPHVKSVGSVVYGDQLLPAFDSV